MIINLSFCKMNDRVISIMYINEIFLFQKMWKLVGFYLLGCFQYIQCYSEDIKGKRKLKKLVLGWIQIDNFFVTIKSKTINLIKKSNFFW